MSLRARKYGNDFLRSREKSVEKSMDIPPITSVPSTAALDSATSPAERLAHLYHLLDEESRGPNDGEAKKRRLKALRERIERLTKKPAVARFDGQVHRLDTLA